MSVGKIGIVTGSMQAWRDMTKPDDPRAPRPIAGGGLVNLADLVHLKLQILFTTTVFRNEEKILS